MPEKIRSLARIAITAAWDSRGEKRTADAGDLVMNTATGKPLTSGPWLYTGSLITEAGFRSEQTGDIIAVFSDPAAIVNYPGKSRNLDDVWVVNSKRLPAKGTPVRITIKPYDGKAGSSTAQQPKASAIFPEASESTNNELP